MALGSNFPCSYVFLMRCAVQDALQPLYCVVFGCEKPICTEAKKTYSIQDGKVAVQRSESVYAASVWPSCVMS